MIKWISLTDEDGHEQIINMDNVISFRALTQDEAAKSNNKSAKTMLNLVDGTSIYVKQFVGAVISKAGLTVEK